MKLPRCYGLLYDEDETACQTCLIQDVCKKAMDNDERTLTPTTTKITTIPKERRRLVLAVCKKYGISTSYTSRKTKETYDITEENVKEFFNLDFLVVSKSALVKLLETKLV